MSSTTSSTADPTPSDWKKIAGVTGALTAVIVVFLLAFALPNVNSGPRQIPVVLVAPAATAAAITQGLADAEPDAFDITVADDADEARDRIHSRQAYGAFVVTADGLTVQTASAASYAVSVIVSGAGDELATALGLPVMTEDVVPFPDADPHGIGLSAGALPIALGGWIAAVGILSAIHGTRQRLIAAASFAVLGGLALTAVLQFWIGTLTGSYWLTSLAAVLGIAATSFLVLGLQRMLKTAGMAIAAVVLVLLGNPLSGLGSAPELLPAPWGAIGQFLPPGATGTLLRNTAFFDGAATTVPVLVLLGWFVLGLALYWVAVSRSRRSGLSAD